MDTKAHNMKESWLICLSDCLHLGLKSDRRALASLALSRQTKNVQLVYQAVELIAAYYVITVYNTRIT